VTLVGVSFVIPSTLKTILETAAIYPECCTVETVCARHALWSKFKRRLYLISKTWTSRHAKWPALFAARSTFSNLQCRAFLYATISISKSKMIEAQWIFSQAKSQQTWFKATSIKCFKAAKSSIWTRVSAFPTAWYCGHYQSMLSFFNWYVSPILTFRCYLRYRNKRQTRKFKTKETSRPSKSLW